MWKQGDKPVVTVDLGKVENVRGLPHPDRRLSLLGRAEGRSEGQGRGAHALDGKEYASQGSFDFNLRWKDMPVNDVWPDDETL